MLGPALALLGALAIGRAVYPRLLERRAVRRRPLGPDGVIVGASAIEHAREQAAAVLLLHGSGDTPQVLSELCAHLHAKGYAVSAPLLGAHGRALREFSLASAERWHAEVDREYERLRLVHDAVYVVGLSMGGALAITLAARRREIPALVLLAPYVDMPPGIQRLARSSRYWGWLLPYLPSLGRRSIRDPAAAARGLGHGIVTPAALRALYDAMAAAREALPHVVAPTLVIQSREDNRISVMSAERAFQRLGSREKEFVWTEGAGHVITVDFGRERVFALVSDWLQRHQNTKSPGGRPGPSVRRSAS